MSDDNLKQSMFSLIHMLGGTSRVEAGIVKVEMPDGSVWDFTEPTQKKAPNRANEVDVQRRIIDRLRGPFVFERVMHGRNTETVHYRIHDANDDPIARTHEECYANYIVDALNRLLE